MEVRNRMSIVLIGIAALLPCLPARATYNATAVGTVLQVTQYSTSLAYSPETISFVISNQPSVSCAQFQYFVISPSTVTDAQTRKNLVALLLEAKATGGTVQVAYDSQGGFCDQGMIGIYYVTAL